MKTRPNTKIQPDTTTADKRKRTERDRDEGITGWKMQRRRHELERAEQALWTEAIATGTKLRGGTFKVKLPAEYSRPEFWEGTDPETGETTLEPTGADLDANGCETVEVTLPRSVIADPRAAQLWTWERLSAAALQEADAARKGIRPMPSEDAAWDVAGDLIVEILKRTHKGMPRKDEWTRDRLRVAIRRDLIDAQREDRNAAQDADADPTADDITEVRAAAERKRAQRDTEDLEDPTADNLPPEVVQVAEHLDLPEPVLDALRAQDLRAAEIGLITDRSAATTRVRVNRGRAALDALQVDGATGRSALRPLRTLPLEAASHALTERWNRLSEGPLRMDRLSVADAARRRTLRQAATAAAARSDRDRTRQLLAIARDLPTYSGPAEPEPIGHTRKATPFPDRYPARSSEDEGDAFTVAHAETRERIDADAITI